MAERKLPGADDAPAFTREEIIKLRKDLDLSQDAFARRLRVSQRTVWAWESGKKAGPNARFRMDEMRRRLGGK